MAWYDWLIVILPVLFVYGMGIYSNRYIKDVTAFLSAGRICGRYVISIGDIANGLSVIALLAYVEIHYKTGFALSFWSALSVPIGMMLGLYGFCTYRFRETKAQSIGQFFEMRYSRKFRVFAAGLRSFAEVLANMIMPALAARFFMYFLELPKNFNFLGFNFSTFNTIMIFVLFLAVSIICFGGSVAIIVTDTIQGFICYPLMTMFVLFVLYKFSWSNEVMPVLSARIAGENFLNPYDIKNLRDFNYFFLFVSMVALVFHRSSWAGSGGNSSAARSPHEQKMASLLGTWRGAIGSVFYVLIAIAVIVFLNHGTFSKDAHKIRKNLSHQIANDIIPDASLKEQLKSSIENSKEEAFYPEENAPLSQKNNVDTRYLSNVSDVLNKDTEDVKTEGKNNSLFQQFRTLYYQQLLPATLKNILPPGMLGLFCLLMILAMISTDDSRIFSSAITISQDVVLPFIKKQLTPKQHIWILRIVTIIIGVIFFLGSSYMAQLDYINMYVTLVCTMWLGGCGPVIVLGLYSKFGSTLGAWASLLNGVFMSLFGVLIQRNWADVVYPWLVQHDLVTVVSKILHTLSRPFHPYIVWEMDAIKCPINSYEWYFLTMIISLAFYILFSFVTYKKPFNLERMLHRGKYALDNNVIVDKVWTKKNFYNKLIGITSEYTLGDKIIAWAYFVYSIIYRFLGTFLVVAIWNIFSPWPMHWWGYYFLIVFVLIPGIIAAFTAVWFGICGTIDLRAMFCDLKKRVINPLDNGRVENNMSLADKSQLEAVDKQTTSKVND